jgi:hypothetical protein
MRVATEAPDPELARLIRDPPPMCVSSLLVRLRMVSTCRESFLEGVFFMFLKRRTCDFFPPHVGVTADDGDCSSRFGVTPS